MRFPKVPNESSVHRPPLWNWKLCCSFKPGSAHSQDAVRKANDLAAAYWASCAQSDLDMLGAVLGLETQRSLKCALGSIVASWCLAPQPDIGVQLAGFGARCSRALRITSFLAKRNMSEELLRFVLFAGVLVFVGLGLAIARAPAVLALSAWFGILLIGMKFWLGAVIGAGVFLGYRLLLSLIL